MGKKKFSPQFIGELLARLNDKWSHRVIISHYKKKGIDVSSSYLTKLTKNQENQN